MKNCRYCGRRFEPMHPSVRYCNDDCRRLKKNEMHRIGRADKKKIEESMDYSEYLMKNLVEVIQHDYQCTPKAFNEVSKIKVKSYINHFDRKSWYEILRGVNLENTLSDYVVEEYIKFVQKEQKQDMHLFCHQHKYLTYELLQSIGLDYIYESANITKLRYTDKQLRENFMMVKEKCGRIPFYSEFENLTEIAITTYSERFNLKEEVYESILNIYCTEDEIEKFRQARQSRKSQIGKETGKLAAKYNVKDFDDEFARVLEISQKKYGGCLTRRLFDKLSKFSERTFRKKFNLKTWTDVCERYGYKPQIRNKSEYAVLSLIAQITNTNFISQMKFSWLKNENGYKLPCDGYFEEINLVVEFDGSHHRKHIKAYGDMEKFQKTKVHDILRNELIPKQGIKLLRIDSRDNWESEEYIIKRLNEMKIYKGIHY